MRYIDNVLYEISITKKIHFGDIIRTYRKNKHLTQEELSRQLNVNRMTIVKWEKGGLSEPTFSCFKKLIHVLEIPVDVVLKILNLSEQEK